MGSPTKPSVSAIVTTYNQAAFIAEALESVLAQTYEPSEVIVVNDGSTDDTAAQIGPFKDRLRYIFQDNQGVAAARNSGIRHARGQLLAFLDGDDIWEKDKLSVQVDAFCRNPTAGLIAVDGIKFSESGVLSPTLFGSSYARLWKNREETMITGSFYQELLSGNFISTTSQVMIPRSILDRVGLSDVSFKICSDYDLYLRIACAHDITLVREPLTRWRYLSSSVSGEARLRDLNWAEDVIEILKKQLRESSNDHRSMLRKHLRAKLYRTAQEAYYYGREEDRLWAARYLVKLFGRNPMSPPVLSFLAGLWCPRFLLTVFGSIVRKCLSFGGDLKFV